MDGADATASWSPPAWSLVRGYFSPATLFLLLNVVIGTIALTSRPHRRHRDDQGGDEHHHQRRQYHENHQHRYAPAPPAPLARTSSIVERLRSLGLYRFRSSDFPPEYNYSLSAANSTAAAVDEESGSQQKAQYSRSQSEPARTSARPPVGQRGKEDTKPATAKEVKKSTSEVKRLQRAPRAPARAVAVTATATATAREQDAAVEALASEKCVDARADDFINKFRQQLQLQRLNSLLNYKEMLNRGA